MKKILIVEDDDFLVDAYKVKLANRNLLVDIARSGDEAIQMIDGHQYDLFVLDLIVPQKNGLEILSHLRSLEMYKNTPVLIASNVDSRETLSDALKMGANEYFIKSETSLADILRKIDALLV